MSERKTASRDIYQSHESILEATVHISPCHSILGEVGGTPNKIKIISYHSRLALKELCHEIQPNQEITKCLLN